MSHETCENIYKYVPFWGSREVLLSGLTNDVRHKIYDSDFGDIVPLILCNTLKLNIEILYMDGDCYNSVLVIIDTGTQTSSGLYSYKIGDQYNAITRNRDPISSGISGEQID